MLLHDLGWLKFFNARRHSSKNRSGIVLAIERTRTTAVLPADHGYGQVSHTVLPLLSPGKKHHLVVPHHGGNAGAVVYQTAAPLGRAVVSVGHNGYGHPRQQVITGLQQLGFNVSRTDQVHQDIVVPLP